MQLGADRCDMGVLGLAKVVREPCPAVGLLTRCEKGEERKFPFSEEKLV